MKKLAAAVLAATLAAPLSAQEAPGFFTDTYPAHAVGAILEAQAVLEGEAAELDTKTRELISLGVAAQIPCEYCVYAHTKGAMAHGATEAEVREAVAAAAIVRMWSTVLNGNAYDVEAFKMEIDAIGDSN